MTLMKSTLLPLLTVAAWIAGISSGHAAPVPLGDGRTFAGWEGDTNKTWRLEAGAFIGGSLQANVPRNEFLCTTRPYTNFVLRLKFKLTGKSGFINGGVQFRSQRTKNPPNEMCGYQADLGDPEWWGCLYDESRRNKVLAKSNLADVNRVLKRNEWNEYEVRCEGRRIRLTLNGLPTVDYTEPDATLAQWGLIGLQIHGGAVAEIAFKDLLIEELP
jgi:hypothetical protein